MYGEEIGGLASRGVGSQHEARHPRMHAGCELRFTHHGCAHVEHAQEVAPPTGLPRREKG